MHLTFEEYYAARYLVARSKDRAKLIRQHLHQPRWDEPILLALGFVGLDSPEDTAELVETAILAEGEEAKELGFKPSPYEELLGRDYLFALRCLGDNIPVRPKLMKGDHSIPGANWLLAMKVPSRFPSSTDADILY